MSREEDCLADVRRIKRYADEIERTLDSVEALKGEKTWQGPAGNNFRGDWKGHNQAIRDALAAARAEADRVYKQVQEEEGKKKAAAK
ncbi:hypothetical protein ACFYM2_18825 [Streptomyces sp. NPDC006711]|uniref:hypothetical protein n=1 Tax=unclassified Streptomyces TaxID=2593676 RepID=UPI00368FB0C6